LSPAAAAVAYVWVVVVVVVEFVTSLTFQLPLAAQLQLQLVGVAQEQIVAVVIPAVEEVTRYLDHLPPQAEVAEPHGTAEIHKITQVVQVAEHAKEVQSWVLEILPQYPLRKDFQVAHKVAELDHITHRVVVAEPVELA
jgi:hypothetical protein